MYCDIIISVAGPAKISEPSKITVASERNQHCGGEARPEGPTLEAPRAESGVGFLERGCKPPLHQLEGLEERCKLPSGVRGEAPAAKSFSAFWVLQVSSPVVLHCKTLQYTNELRIRILNE